MPLNSKHPQYDYFLTDWELMRDSYAGERAVKAAGFKYLPATPGQIIDGAMSSKATGVNNGLEAYKAYRTRARFPNYVEEAVNRFVGMLHQKEASIELPTRMEGMLKKATQGGETMLNLLRRINTHQLISGRIGLMLDLPVETAEGETPLPYVAVYEAPSVINWDSSDDHEGVNSLNFVVLDETGPQRISEFEWESHERYRVLMLGQPRDEEGVPIDATEDGQTSIYYQGVFDVTEGQSFSPLAMLAPVFMGQTLSEIPFVMVNATDILTSPSKPPLLGLGELCMTIYRADADHRHTLFLQGQDTLVVIGQVGQGGEIVTGGDALRVGAGARIDTDVGGDAKYIGVGADGLEGQRESLRDDRKEAETMSGTLISPSAGKQESGDALTTRLSAQTASLTRIAQTGAAALENILKVAAKWMNEDPDKVKVTPNLEFAINMINGQELTQIMAARTMGAPISKQSIHAVLVDRGWTKMEYEVELALIEEEDMQSAKLTASLPQPPAPPAPAGRGA